MEPIESGGDKLWITGGFRQLLGGNYHPSPPEHDALSNPLNVLHAKRGLARPAIVLL